MGSPGSVARIKTQHLVLVAALAEHGSMLRAARAVNLSQPACSKLLHQLEVSVGAPLFTRHARGMAPTGEGEAFVQHARAALREIARAGDAVAAIRSGLVGNVAIGTEATSATTLVPRAVAGMKERHPFVTVSVELAFSEALVREVRAGRLDLAVARLGSAADEVDLEVEPLRPSPHVLAVRADHPLLSRRTVAWPELLEYGWILPPAGNVMRTSLALLLRGRGLELPSEIIETAALPVIVSLLRRTDYVAPLPGGVVQDHVEQGTLGRLAVALRLQLRPACIIRRREEAGLLGRAMLRALREAAAAPGSGPDRVDAVALRGRPS